MSAEGNPVTAEPGRRVSGILDLPELNVAVFAFLLNFVWEMWQVPFWREMPTAPHFQAVQECTLATLGDVLIALVSFWTVAAWVRSRHWVVAPGTREVLGFVAVGVGVTVAGEWILTK